MASPKAPKDKFFEKVNNPYLAGVLQHPQSIEMRVGVLHIRDVEGPKKTGSMEARLEAMEQQVFKCQGMVERGLNANLMMITEFTNKHKIDANDIGKNLSRLYDRIDHLQAEIYDLQNQNFSFEALDKGAIEILGPYGISYTFRRLAERISQLQSGSVVRRVRYEPWPPTSLTARHLQFTIEAQMETDEIQALAKVDIQALDKR
ncbi:40S ribosomal protein S5-1 [Hordeum vulgare]|nr:40S ribosomal protein S5-1 [Hordeum vulgare]